MKQFVRQRGLPSGEGTDAGVLVQRDPDTVRPPDAFAIARDRLPNRRNPASYVDVTPDLAAVYRSPSEARLLRPGDTLDAEPALPGFACRVSDFGAEKPAERVRLLGDEMPGAGS